MTKELDHTIVPIFALRLRLLREKRCIKQTVLSELCGLDKKAVSDYEKGERVPSIRAVCSIADYFNVTTDYLLGRTYGE